MRRILAIVTTVCAVGVLLPPRVLADTMSSTNYKVQADVISTGGARSTSTGFIAEDTLGDLATGEDLSSASFKACAGYQCFLLAPYITFSER
jgi:hypothetical protein